MLNDSTFPLDSARKPQFRDDTFSENEVWSKISILTRYGTVKALW